MAKGTVIIGAGIGGVRTAERLRRAGYDDPIRIISAEPGLPYDRPHLSKGAITEADAPQPQQLTTAEKLAEARIELVDGRVIRVDPADRSVELSDGGTLSYDYLVVAIGAVPRRIPIFGDAANVHVLRTWDDALRVRTAVRSAGRVVVIGAGVLGLEIASSAREVGAEVEVIDLAPTPVARLGGPDFGAAVARLHESRGVSLRLGTSIDHAEIVDGMVRSIALGNGDELPADVIVVAVGASPELGWLESTGLLDAGQLRADERCRTRDERILAVGDAASIKRPNGLYERHEHFTNAVDSAGLAAAGIAEHALGVPQRTLEELPYVWSDQHGVKIQILGTVNPDEPLETVADDPETGQRLQISSRDGVAVAVVGWNMPAALNRCRNALMRGTATADLIAASPWVRKAA